MTFTTLVKEELLVDPELDELLGLLHTKSRDHISFKNKKVARYFLTLAKTVTKTEIKTNKICNIFLQDVKIKLNNRAKYFKGAFLSTGYISNPQMKNSLEIIFSYEDKADFFLKQLELAKIYGKKYFYKDKFKIGIRRVEDIKNFLFKIGAKESFFAYENTTIMRGIKSENTRSINLELANEDRRAKAVAAQLKIINKLENIPKILVEYIKYRKAYPEHSNRELALLMNISISSLKNRVKKLKECVNKFANISKS